ncbi:hypothetical protein CAUPRSCDRAFT_11823, partial [Caulochytrium protostelioides]
MANPLQRRKARSGRRKVTVKAKKDLLAVRRPTTALNADGAGRFWDKNLSPEENYRRMGLTSRLQGFKGGSSITKSAWAASVATWRADATIARSGPSVPADQVTGLGEYSEAYKRRKAALDAEDPDSDSDADADADPAAEKADASKPANPYWAPIDEPTPGPIDPATQVLGREMSMRAHLRQRLMAEADARAVAEAAAGMSDSDSDSEAGDAEADDDVTSDIGSDVSELASDVEGAAEADADADADADREAENPEAAMDAAFDESNAAAQAVHRSAFLDHMAQRIARVRKSQR